VLAYICIYIRLQYSNNSSLKAMINGNLINEKEKGLKIETFKCKEKGYDRIEWKRIEKGREPDCHQQWRKH
jgi:hypothetical protein